MVIYGAWQGGIPRALTFDDRVGIMVAGEMKDKGIDMHKRPSTTIGSVTVYNGDCREVMATLDPESIHALVSDPPYGISFMSRKWDYDVPGEAIWREALRVLKPGAHALAFAGTRTYHRMAVRIEGAGFEIRDMISWLYGSGFPKSLDISKAIDRAAGAEREVVGTKAGLPGWRDGAPAGNSVYSKGRTNGTAGCLITAPVTDEAQHWQGWGTALKPACEPVVLARKPLTGTVAQNVLDHSTGGLNVDGCRIGSDWVQGGNGSLGKRAVYGNMNRDPSTATVRQGRWPANVILDEEAGSILDAQTGKEVSRYFYCAKASRSEREAGLEHLDSLRATDVTGRKEGSAGQDNPRSGRRGKGDIRNSHPTVKPIDLMRYLVRLVTPPDGIVLDPFGGSGTTGVAAVLEGRRAIVIEREPEYYEIACARVRWAMEQADASEKQLDLLSLDPL